MTTDEVLQAVKEAGFGINHAEASAILFTRFAAIVAAAEREACANLAQQYAGQVGDVAWTIAGGIRARSRA